MLARSLALVALAAGWPSRTVVAALPAKVQGDDMHAGVQLDAASWTENTSKGIWLVEHYSPYCSHCKAFAPTWIQLVDGRSDQSATIDLHFGQVDCSVQGDLCDSNKVRGYPSLFLYENGEFVEQFKKDRTLERLNKWLDERLPEDLVRSSAVSASAAAAKTATAASEEVKSEKTPAIVAPQGGEIKVAAKKGTEADDQPDPQAAPKPHANGEAAVQAQQTSAKAASSVSSSATAADAQPLQVQQHYTARKTHPNAEGELLVADLKRLEELIDKKSEAGPVFVKYYAPWCGHCKKLAPTWKELATRMRNRVNIVEFNCDLGENKGRCRAEGITGYPTLLYYNGGERAEYNGGRTLAQLEAFAGRLAAGSDGLKLIGGVEDLQAAAKDEEVFFLYLHPADHRPSESALVQTAAKSLLAAAPVFEASSQQIYESLKLSSGGGSYLLVFKDNDVTTPAGSLDIKLPATSTSADVKEEAARYESSMIRWMQDNKFPTVAELDTTNYKDYFEPSSRSSSGQSENFIVVAALSKKNMGAQAVGTYKDELAKISRAWSENLRFNARDKPTHFVWVDADQWGKWLNQNYALRPVGKLPSVIVANPLKEQYYHVDEQKQPLDIDGRQLMAVLDSAYGGRLKPQSSVSVFERMGRSMFARVHPFFMWIGEHPILSSITAVFGFLIFICILVAVMDRDEVPARPFSSTRPSVYQHHYHHHQPKYVPASSSLYTPSAVGGVKKD